MNENEVIIVDGITRADYDSLIMDCVKYAIISLPFTVDRMKIPDDRKRAMNIAKGKIAEAIFRFFCRANNIHPDFDACATPFWTVDNRDFLLNGNEWDIKNNYYYCAGDEYAGDYTLFPALVPNRFDGDQWSKRNDNLHPGSNGVEFLFTFLKDADLTNGERGREFMDINLTDAQLRYISSLYRQYQGQPQQRAPFSERDFWERFSALGGMNLFTLHFRPNLIITAYANRNCWNQFQNTGPYDRLNTLRTAVRPFWYSKFGSGAISFLNGTLWTKITNETCLISQLPSFLSLYPHLRQGIVYGHIKQ